MDQEDKNRAFRETEEAHAYRQNLCEGLLEPEKRRTFGDRFFAVTELGELNWKGLFSSGVCLGLSVLSLDVNPFQYVHPFLSLPLAIILILLFLFSFHAAIFYALLMAGYHIIQWLGGVL